VNRLIGGVEGVGRSREEGRCEGGGELEGRRGGGGGGEGRREMDVQAYMYLQ